MKKRNTLNYKTTTTVRIAVARLEFTPSIPIFAKIEVSAAKTADKIANMNHIESLHLLRQKMIDGPLDDFQRTVHVLLLLIYFQNLPLSQGKGFPIPGEPGHVHTVFDDRA